MCALRQQGGQFGAQALGNMSGPFQSAAPSGKLRKHESFARPPGYTVPLSVDRPVTLLCFALALWGGACRPLSVWVKVKKSMVRHVKRTEVAKRHHPNGGGEEEAPPKRRTRSLRDPLARRPKLDRRSHIQRLFGLPGARFGAVRCLLGDGGERRSRRACLSLNNAAFPHSGCGRSRVV